MSYDFNFLFKEAAESLGIPVATIYSLALKGRVDISLKMNPARERNRRDYIENIIKFSPNMDFIIWNGDTYPLGIIQARIIKTLYDKHLIGEKIVSSSYLLSESQSSSFNINSIFNKSPLWNNLIIKVKRGYYSLNL